MWGRGRGMRGRGAVIRQEGEPVPPSAGGLRGVCGLVTCQGLGTSLRPSAGAPLPHQ